MINKEVKLDSLCLLAVNETTDQPSLHIAAYLLLLLIYCCISEAYQSH